jgi:hypothetical protein
VFVDVQDAGVVEEVAPDGGGCGGSVSGEVAGEEAVEVAGDDGEGDVEVGVEWVAGEEGVAAPLNTLLEVCDSFRIIQKVCRLSPRCGLSVSYGLAAVVIATIRRE